MSRSTTPRTPKFLWTLIDKLSEITKKGKGKGGFGI